MADLVAATRTHISTTWELIRSCLIWIVGVLFTLSLIFLAAPFILFRVSRVIHGIGFYWGSFLTFISGTKLTVEGKEKLHRSGPAVFLINHQSLFDIMVLFMAIDVQFRWMAKHTLFRIPFFGWAMSAAGYIPVNRTDKKKALESLYQAADQVKLGKSVIVFPEGTRGHPDGSMIAFKKGGFILAKKAGVVIQPVTIWGAANVMPVQKQYTVQRIYPGNVTVVIHDPIQPEEYANLEVEDLLHKVRGIIESPMPRLREKEQLITG